MKIIKAASGKKTIKISKKEWESIGAKQGWIEKASEIAEVSSIDHKVETLKGFIAEQKLNFSPP